MTSRNWCEQCDAEGCSGCRQDCGCDTHAEHNAGIEESLRDFLRDPGPLPAHWDAETVERVTATIDRARGAK